MENQELSEERKQEFSKRFDDLSPRGQKAIIEAMDAMLKLESSKKLEGSNPNPPDLK